MAIKLLDLMEQVGQTFFFKCLDRVSDGIRHDPFHPWHEATSYEDKMDILRSEMAEETRNPSSDSRYRFNYPHKASNPLYDSG